MASHAALRVILPSHWYHAPLLPLRMKFSCQMAQVHF